MSGRNATRSIEVRDSHIHGLGVFATRDIRTGQRIGTYAGKRYAGDIHDDGFDNQLTYLFGLSDGSLIDGAEGGNATRHLNHACEPNVEAVEEERADGRLQVYFVAMRPIAQGEELFLDYALVIDGDPSEYVCRCGAASCRGTMAGPVE